MHRAILKVSYLPLHPRGTTIPKTHTLQFLPCIPSAAHWYLCHLPLVNTPILLQIISLPLLSGANYSMTMLASVTSAEIGICRAALYSCRG